MAAILCRSALLAHAIFMAGCSYGPDPDRNNDFVVLFGAESDRLDASGERIVAAAAGAAQAHHLDVTVAFYADAPTSPESNQIRSRIRGQVVANALVARGVPRDRVTLAPRHGVGADPGLESERVEIRVGS